MEATKAGMAVRCHHREGSQRNRRRYPAYLLKGNPADARLVVLFPDEDRVVIADEAQSLNVSFLNATDEELFVLHEGGYSIVD